jgi:AcrR family transcriptional regulator
LLDAAEVVFGEKGFEAASIADITRQAGTATGSFYLYFPTKKDVFVELVDELGRRLREVLRAATVNEVDRLDAERVGLEAFFAFARKHHNLYRIVRQAEFVDEAAYRRYYRAFASGYARSLAMAMAKGQLRRLNPELVGWMLMGIADFVGMRWVLWEEKRQGDLVLDQVMDFIRHGLTPPRRRATPRASPLNAAPQPRRRR